MSRVEDNGKTIATNFGELGLETDFVRGVESPMGETLLFNLKYMSQYNKPYIKSLVEKIAIFHHLDMTMIDSKETHFGVFVSYQSKLVSLSNLLCVHREITIGIDTLGNPIQLDFSKIPHILVAGTTGSGKSVLLHNIICNLMVWYGRNHTKTPQFIIIDPKGNELNMYANVKNTTFVNNTQGAIATLQACCNEMDRRYQQNDMNASDLYIIIDELADLMLTSKFEVEERIVRLAQKGRACGIHLIVATQTPRVSVVSGLIKANLPYRICLKTANLRDSVVLADRKGCEDLKVGEAYFTKGCDFIRFKIAFPENELINKVIETNRG